MIPKDRNLIEELRRVKEELFQTRDKLATSQGDACRLFEDLSKKTAELNTASETVAALKIEVGKSTDSTHLFKESNHLLAIQLRQESLKFETQGRLMAEMQKKLEAFGRSDSDLDRDIEAAIQDCDRIEEESGPESSNHKFCVQHLERLISIKHQIAEHRSHFASGPGSTSQAPPEKKSSSRKRSVKPSRTKKK